jgi:GAF domain-containing protein
MTASSNTPGDPAPAESPESGPGGTEPTASDPTGSGDAPSVDLAAALNQMSGLVLSRETVDSALELVTTLAVTVTPGTLGAGVTIVDAHGTRSRAASNAVTREADARQYELDEGPCLTSWRHHAVVRIDDTTTDSRWPRWSPVAAELGVRSVLSASLIAGDEAVGAMKVYSGRPRNYGPHDEQVIRLLADQAAILLANSQSLRAARTLSRQLTQALTDRDAISRATGVLMARGATGRREAFAALSATARKTGRPVTEVAHALLAALDGRRGRSPDGGTSPT